MMKKTKDINSLTVYVLLKIMLAIGTCLIGLVAYYSVTGTFYFRDYMDLGSLYVTDSLPKNLLVFGIFVLLSVIAYKIFDGKVNRKERFAGVVLGISSVLLLAVGIFYLKDHPYYMDGDQINTFYGAVYSTMVGDDIRYLMFQRGGYLGIYPQQKGLVVFYVILYKIFGDDAFVRIQYLHLIYPQIVLFSGYSILKTEKVSPFARIIFCMFMISCVPMYMYLPYMYGDLGSIAFSFLAALFLVRFGKSGKIRYAVGLCASCTVALLLRKQIWIFIMAIVIVMMLIALKNKKLRYAAAALCVVIAAWGTFACIDAYYGKVSGYGHVEGVPSICWVVMGLQETNGQPGIYNRYNQGVFEANGCDADLTRAVAKEDLKERLEFLREYPIYTRLFFASKIRQEWTAPDFEALKTTSVWKAESGRDPSNAPGWLVSLYGGVRYAQVMGFANLYQSVVYLCAALLALTFLLKKKPEIPVSAQLALIYCIGGILFFTVWENKSRYVFPFFMSIILLVPFFLDGIAPRKGFFVNFFKSRTPKG